MSLSGPLVGASMLAKSAARTMDLALCLSLKPPGTPSSLAEDFAELDGPDVLEALRGALQQLGTVRIWDTVTLSPAEIAAQPPPDLVFNVSEGLRGSGREAQAPALFEW